jgi:hypothetical protein
MHLLGSIRIFRLYRATILRFSNTPTCCEENRKRAPNKLYAVLRYENRTKRTRNFKSLDMTFCRQHSGHRGLEKKRGTMKWEWQLGKINVYSRPTYRKAKIRMGHVDKKQDSYYIMYQLPNVTLLITACAPLTVKLSSSAIGVFIKNVYYMYHFL